MGILVVAKPGEPPKGRSQDKTKLNQPIAQSVRHAITQQIIQPDPRERAIFLGYSIIVLRLKLIAKLFGGPVNSSVVRQI
jgi:hypothetical protein